MIEIRDLTFTYPQQTTPALHNLSLHVSQGEFVLLVGESGSGKSTLLRCLNGLVPHLSGGVISGSVQMNGLDAIAAGPQQMSQHVGFVFQSPENQAVMDRVEPEIAFGLENSTQFRPHRHESSAEKARIRQEMQARVTAVLDLLNLTHLRERPHHTLSGGERQKVALASALVLQPALLALDEPTSQLDPQAAAELLDALVQLNREHGYTILLAEHRLERVLPFASRVLLMENGRLTLDAPPRAAAARLPQAPPVVALGRRLGWEPLPLTVAEARPFVNGAASHPAPPTVAAPAHAAAAEKAPLLTVNEVSFAYDAAPILREVSLTVGAGEMVALLGPNGAGKSTLLRCLVGLLQPPAGEVWVNGRSTRDRTTADICRDVAYLPQNPDDLLFAETVAEELAITRRNHTLPADDTADQQLLAQLGLAELASAYPRDLSVGQRQRTALAAVTVTQPDLMLLDEPTRGLDYAAKAALAAIWREWLAQGKAILLVTHDVELAAQAAQRVVILEEGQITAAGETAVVLPNHPTFAPQISQLFPKRPWLTVAAVKVAEFEKV